MVGCVAVVGLAAPARPARGADQKVTVHFLADNPGETPVFTEIKAAFPPASISHGSSPRAADRPPPP